MQATDHQRVMQEMLEAIAEWDSCAHDERLSASALRRYKAAQAAMIASAYPTHGCVGCGDCCDVIFLPFDEKTLKERAKNLSPDADERSKADFAFMAEHWTELDPDEGLARLERIFGPGFEANQSSHRFQCDKFDAESRRCMAYADRPPICSKFPYYDRKPEKMALPLRCSYWRDIPKEEWDPGVEPMGEPGSGTPLESAAFSGRVFNALRRNGIHSIEQARITPDEEFLTFLNFGVGMLREVREKTGFE